MQGPVDLDVEIRQYARTDRETVWELHNVALEDAGAHAGHGEFDEDLHRIDEAYLSAGGEFLVATSGGRIVGMGGLRRASGGLAEITRMRVHPDSQRRGIGRAVLRRLIERARELGYTGLALGTTVGQTAARKLYESEGFVETGRSAQYGFEVIQYGREIAGRGE